MAEEIDEGDFYRENFSADSDWELFNAQLGDVLQKWDTATPLRQFREQELFSCSWQIRTEQLELAELQRDIAVDYYTATLEDNDNQIENDAAYNFHQDLISLRNNFGPPISKKDHRSGALHALGRIYGLRRFIVIHPVKLQTQYFTKTAEFNFFLSSAAVVAAETACTVPIFVQIYDPKWNFFIGVGLAPMLRTNFDLVGLEQAPPECRYLSGLINIFKEKLPTSYTQPAMVSVRTTYAMETMQIRIPMHVPFANGANFEDIAITGQITKLSTSHFHALPHGYFPDSCTECYAVYTWPELSEYIALDSAQRTDFVPTKAPYGNMYLSVQATSYLGSCLRDYQKISMSLQTLESFVGRNFSGTSSGAEAVNPLDQLTQKKVTGKRNRNYDLPALSAITKRLPGPMNENELNQMLAYLFPDMYPDIALFPYNKHLFDHKFDPMRIKTAAPDTLVTRLGSLLATCNAHFGGQSGMAQLWAAFTRQLRLLWDNCLTVPGIAAGFPDTRTCLLHQKLQMLNVCVERTLLHQSMSKKRLSYQKMVNPNSPKRRSATPEDDDEDDENNGADDEFYDCDEQLLAEVNLSYVATATSDKPEGRLKRLGEEKLLEHAEEYLYIPVVQDPVPKTEDQLAVDAEIMLKMGPNSGLTTKMMCTSLLSDMEAFKAANPHAVMADFIRWYSPKDWEQTEESDGEITQKLSARMQTPGNTWLTIWEQAQPIPATRQKRLFDDTNEALKVLHYLETCNMSEIYGLTALPAVHAAVLLLVDIFKNAGVDSIFGAQIESLLGALCRLSREVAIDEVPNVGTVLAQLEQLETLFYQYQCFSQSFNDAASADIQQQFANIIAREDNCAIQVGTGARLTEMLKHKFKSSGNMDEQLISKDYIIRVNGVGESNAAETFTATTATTSSSTSSSSSSSSSNAKEHYLGPQFLRAIVTGEKLRLCGAFTESTTFV